MPSFSDQQRSALLASCTALLYTPTNEHFGIVPLEAMACGRPVIACNSGGPRETILNGRTGFLCEPQPQSFAAALRNLLVPHFTPSVQAAMNKMQQAGTITLLGWPEFLSFFSYQTRTEFITLSGNGLIVQYVMHASYSCKVRMENVVYKDPFPAIFPCRPVTVRRERWE